MLTKIETWGDGLGLRIPQAFALDAQLEKDAVVEITLVDGQIVITPVNALPTTLENLLAGITPANCHPAING